MTVSSQDLQDASNGAPCDELDIYHEDKKLFEVLGLDLSIHFISTYQAKPLKMFTFLCNREFRRDEYGWHVKNFHSDIQRNLNNWFEQRCPLSYAGCTFSFQRFNPGRPNGTITHSPILQSLGFSNNEEFQNDTENPESMQEVLQTEVGRMKLREATPEIHTSYKCDSHVQFVPRYKSISRETSPVKHQFDFDDDFQHSLTNLPFEVLQNIVQYLDSFSIQLVAMTCKLLQSVCCSLLEERGIVSLVWEKKSPDMNVQRPLWNVAYKRWSFSLGFQPVKQWSFNNASQHAITEHLKQCTFNKDLNVPLSPFHVVYDVNEVEGISREEMMARKRESRKAGYSDIRCWRYND